MEKIVITSEMAKKWKDIATEVGLPKLDLSKRKTSPWYEYNCEPKPKDEK